MAQSKEESITIDHLPIEILSKIFSYLKVRHRKISSLVCTKWRNATRCPSFYRTLRLHEGLHLDEPPLSLFQNSYHPFSVIIFEDIDEFTQDISEFWKVVKDSVRELHFTSCEGLDSDILSTLLTHLEHVNKIKIIGSISMGLCKLERNFDNVKELDLKNTEMPERYIEPLAESFPNLRVLHLGSYTYDGWDANEDYMRNTSTTASTSAFGDWIKNLCKLAPRVTLSYDYQIVLRTEVILKEFLDLENLEVRSLNLNIAGLNAQIFQKFLEVKGKHLQKLEILDAHLLKEEQLALLNKCCTNLKNIRLNFHEGTTLPILEQLSNLSKLEKLAIHGPESLPFEFNLTKKRLDFKQMRTLVIVYAKIESELESFQFLLDSFPYLKELTLEGCVVTPNALKIIYGTCKSLEVLDLTCDEQITDNGLFGGGNEPTINDLTQLESLNLNQCTNITNRSLKRFKWKEMFKIGLREITQINVDGITELCKNCPTINQLDFNGCVSVNDECVEVITKLLPRLMNIDLSSTGVTSKSLEYIAENCLEIKNVDISYKPPKDSKAGEKLLQMRVLHFLSALAMNNICERLLDPERIQL